MEEYSIINKCPITDSTERVTYFDLGNFPLVNNLNDTREESLNCARYPLAVNIYPKSNLSALTCAVKGELLFSNYLFKSEVNVPYIKHCQEMFKWIRSFVYLSNGDTIIDIGGNDGTLLSAFKSASDIDLRYLNIDPSRNLAQSCQDKGIPVVVDFFSEKLASSLPKVKVVTSTNVFQHLKDINSFVKGIHTMLADDGIWLLEFPYWIHDMLTNQFDQIYHEHVYYYSVKPLKMLFEKHGLKLIDVVKQEIHGGTLRLIITKQESSLQELESVQNILDFEEKFDMEYYENWGEKIRYHLDQSKELLLQYKQEGKKIAGFGAAAKGCIFLNSIEVDHNILDYIIDDTDIKQGKYIPGTGIEVVSREILNEEHPDVILILAHNFAEHIIKSLRYENGYNGTFLTLLPKIQITT